MTKGMATKSRMMMRPSTMAIRSDQNGTRSLQRKFYFALTRMFSGVPIRTGHGGEGLIVNTPRSGPTPRDLRAI